jgi:PAS domain S-box-containing protein
MKAGAHTTLLVVEDDEGLSRLQQRRLERAGYKVICAADAAQGLQYVMQGGIDLLVLDHHLPNGVTGLDLFRQVREARLNLPAILVTGYSTDAVLIEALRAGMLDFIPKTPEYIDDLLSAIARVLKQTQAERQLEETQHRLVREEAARAAAERLAESLRKLVHALPAAIYTCDEQGRITMYNEAAVELWGREPELSNENWCGSWRIYRTDGTPVMLEQCPLPVALREQRLVRGEEIIIERPDGTRRNVIPYPEPMFDASGNLQGTLIMIVDVTHRRQAEEGQRASEARFSAMANNAPAIIWTAAPDGTITFASDRWFEYTGMTREQNAREWPIVLHPDDREPCMTSWRKALAEGKEYEAEVRNRRYDGVYRWFVTRATPVRSETGEITCWFGSTTDIHDRKQAEEALHKQNERLQLLSRALLQLLSAQDPIQIMRELFPEVARHLGVDTYFHYLVNAGERELVPHAYAGIPDRMNSESDRLNLARAICGNLFEDRETIVAFDVQHSSDEGLALARQQGIQAYVCKPLISHNRLTGALAFVSCKRSRFDDDELEFMRLIARYLAVATDRARAEESLGESQRRLATLAELVPQLVWTTQPDGQVDYLNERWFDYTGQTRDEALGHGWADALHPEDRERAWRCRQEALENNQPIDVEYRLRAADGKYEWFLDRGVPLKDEFGRVVKWFGTCTGIDTQKRLEAELIEADRRKDAFLATLAHELRNPLAPLVNSLELIRTASLDGDQLSRLHAIMARQVAQLRSLVDDLLDVSRITRNKIELRRESLPLSKILEDALEISRPIVEAAGHELSVDSQSDALSLSGDCVRLVQVISNLLNNAAKFTNPKGRIWLSCNAEDGYAVIRVRDSGIGISPEMLPRIFDLFTQGDSSTTREHGGLGVGLSLAKSLVELHGGTLEAASPGLGMGSEFTVRLPLEATTQPISHQVEPIPCRQTVPRLQVLVVDDTRASAFLVSQMLMSLGQDVTTANSATAALAAIDSRRPHLVVTDIAMPGMDGYELAQEIRRRLGTSVRLVALSGYGQERERATDAGFDDYLVKPVNLANLRAVLEDVSARVGSCYDTSLS